MYSSLWPSAGAGGVSEYRDDTRDDAVVTSQGAVRAGTARLERPALGESFSFWSALALAIALSMPVWLGIAFVLTRG